MLSVRIESEAGPFATLLTEHMPPRISRYGAPKHFQYAVSGIKEQADFRAKSLQVTRGYEPAARCRKPSDPSSEFVAGHCFGLALWASTSGIGSET